MLKNLILNRPLAVVDLETTGTDARDDRIVEISVLKILPDGSHRVATRLLNPGIPIPAEATAIHNIDDASVADAPHFEAIADRLLAFLDGCDLCGFNLKKFDLQILRAEFARAGRTLSLEDRAIIDPMEIYHAYEPRNLAAAVRFYCGREHAGGHRAEADVQAAVEILDAMLGRYADLPRNVDDLFQRFKDPRLVDAARRFTNVRGHIRFTFGKHRGEPLDEVAAQDPDYLDWMLSGSFFEDTKQVVRDALARVQAAVQTLGQPSPALQPT
jgi:DNA polymerase-3 subunit epsilon